MPLAVGTRLGNYQVVGQLGVGGMGEVYRANDTKLDREVAIKILPAAFAQHPDRLARFEREAKVLASLNHPNIASIYAVEESSDGKALVMELVEGETLKGPVPVHIALKYAAQIASALDAAHEKGIQGLDLVGYFRPPQSPLRGSVIFKGDQLPVPRQQSLGRDERGHFSQKLPTQALGLGGQSTALVVVEPHSPSAELLA
jgi:hypothetical protein